MALKNSAKIVLGSNFGMEQPDIPDEFKQRNEDLFSLKKLNKLGP